MVYSSIIVITGKLAVGTTILQFLSGMLICRQYLTKRSTGESTSLPFICGLLSCALWLYYGQLKDDINIVNVNLVGVLLMSVYTVIFYIFTFNKSLVIKQCFLVAVSFFIMALFARSIDSRDQLIYFVGFMASIFTLAFIGAPMSKLFHVIKVKNTECLPFPMIIMSFLVSNLWTLYGYLVEDNFLKCVNVVGILLSVTQLCLFVIYPSKSTVLPKHLSI